jgi:hypothetical protein
MTVSARLLTRLREELNLELPADARLRSTRASRSARSAGAWSWAAYRADGSELYIGSQFSMGELLRAPALQVSRERDDVHVDPLT